jgi:hypothetical protein
MRGSAAARAYLGVPPANETAVAHAPNALRLMCRLLMDRTLADPQRPQGQSTAAALLLEATVRLLSSSSGAAAVRLPPGALSQAIQTTPSGTSTVRLRKARQVPANSIDRSVHELLGPIRTMFNLF